MSESDHTEEPTPLEKLAAAVQEFVSTMDEHEGTVYVPVAVVCWEQVRYDADGTMLRALQYTLPMDGSSLSGGIGLASAALAMISRDALGSDED